MTTMVTNFLKTYQQLHKNDSKLLLLPKRHLVTYALYALIAVALIYLFVDPAAPRASSLSTTTNASVARPPWIPENDDEPELLPPATSSPLSQEPDPSPSPSPSPYQAGAGHDDDETQTLLRESSSTKTMAAPAPACDYSDGEWVPDPRPPPYNGTTCGAIKDDGRSCTLNGRPDSGYVHWRWRPRGCDLPPFSADAFLRWLRNRHLAFVGDSLARNQGESLVCLLASRSPPELVRRSAADGGRFRRWLFPEFAASVSIFWSPFLVRGAEKSSSDGAARFNQVFLDAFDERWMSELAGIDAAVLSAGHWFRIPSVYHDGGRVVGCHACGLNGTAEVSFFRAFRDAVRRTLAEAARRRSPTKLVALTTFSPSHFEGEWNKGAPCKKKPDGELGYTEAEMRKIVVEEARRAAAAWSASTGVRFAAVDVTALANQRPDGHPGPYMRKNPFAGGNTSGPVQHDCLHWCMPGPVDTFNQLLLQTILGLSTS